MSLVRQYHQKAIQLKYEGKTYKEISEHIGGKITANSLREYFSAGGLLYISYLEYEAEMNGWNMQQAKNDIKRQASFAWKIKRTILQKALKQNNLQLANQILNEILVYAGVPEPLKTIEEKNINVNMSYEQLSAKLRAEGIDPESGLRIGTPAVVSN